VNETEKLSQFITGTDYSDLNDEIIEKAKLLILDQVGCQLAFASLPWNRVIHRYISDMRGNKQESTVTFYGFKTSSEDAAFANAVFGHGFEMDDTELSTAAHPGVTVIPPALAVAESEHSSGKDFLTAVVIGYDVFIRVGLAIRSMMERGFHTTAVLGPLGSAAATSKVLKLNANQTRNAIAIASSCSGGLAEYTETGGTVKRVHAGFAAHNGLRATLLARAGITGPSAVLEGKKGLCQAFANDYSLEQVTNGLGKDFRITTTGNKPYCCCAAQHSALDAVSKITEEYVVTPGEIEKIRVWQNSRDVRTIGNIIEPRDIITAQFSGRFGIALRLTKGNNGFHDYSEENISNPHILALARKIEYYVDNTMETSNPLGAPARVEIHLKNGNIHERTVHFAKGTAENPMTKDELEDKFRQLTASVLPKAQTERIIRAVGVLEKSGDLVELSSLLISPIPMRS